MELFETHCYDEVISQLENRLGYLVETPARIKTLHNIAACQYAMERYRAAVKTCLGVIELDSGNVGFYVLCLPLRCSLLSFPRVSVIKCTEAYETLAFSLDHYLSTSSANDIIVFSRYHLILTPFYTVELSPFFP